MDEKYDSKVSEFFAEISRVAEVNEITMEGIYKNFTGFEFYDGAALEIPQIAMDYELDILTMLENYSRSKNVLDITHASSMSDPKSFMYLMLFGGVNDYFHDACKVYARKALEVSKSTPPAKEFCGYMLDCLENSEDGNSQLNWRAYQLHFLFQITKCIDSVETAMHYEKAVESLWSCIPDAYLTKTEISRIFKGMPPRLDFRIEQLWWWYCFKIRREREDKETYVKCPRSLKHLSRCVVRQKMRECHTLPFGIDKLKIPRSLVNYLFPF